MRLVSIEAIPIRLPRDWASARGTAGSPTALTGTGAYRWSVDYPALYSPDFETALVKITGSDGTVGWGESQAPLAPEVACTVIRHLLAPVLTGTEFEGTVEEIEALWLRMYSTMRVRGQTGGFMLDAISGIDLALWDLAGKMQKKPVSQLLNPDTTTEVPAYLSGVHGTSQRDKIDYAQNYINDGFRLVKIYYESNWTETVHLAEALCGLSEVAVDALWHLPVADAIDYARQLDSIPARWLECPLLPEDADGHAELARSIQTPLAIGESYRTVWELRPFLKPEILRYVQPDLGRSGITEAGRIAAAAAEHGIVVVPHVSIALAPQIAAAIHLSAAMLNCSLCEFNPRVLEAANACSHRKLKVHDGAWLVPQEPGLGIDIDERLASSF